jgi:hypothetical protein
LGEPGAPGVDAVDGDVVVTTGEAVLEVIDIVPGVSACIDIVLPGLTAGELDRGAVAVGELVVRLAAGAVDRIAAPVVE